MKNKIIVVGISIYVLILITYHRFENSKYALDILGDIPTVISAIATSLAFIVASITYVSNSKKEKSKTAYDAYKETTNNLNAVLQDKEASMDFKLYYCSIAYDAIIKIEPLVTEKEHKDLLSSAHVSFRYNIVNLLNKFKVNDYFCLDIQFEKAYFNNVTSCADALCQYWDSNVKGKSTWAQTTNGKMDSFASYPYGIETKHIMKALSLFVSEPTVVAKSYCDLYDLSKDCKSKHGNLLDKIGDAVPLSLAYILLCNQTESMNANGSIQLKLKSVVDTEYWFKHDLKSVGSIVAKIPEYFKKSTGGK